MLRAVWRGARGGQTGAAAFEKGDIMAQKTFCDKCDKEIKESAITYQVSVGHYAKDDDYETWDLCSNCVKVVLRILEKT